MDLQGSIHTGDIQHQMEILGNSSPQETRKANYNAPKSYCPITLYNTMGKLLTAIMMEDMVHLAEKHHLLPANHFGGRPGRTTTDSLHLVVNKIKGAWRCKKVAVMLFLDIEGAFPNAVTDHLLHNM